MSSISRFLVLAVLALGGLPRLACAGMIDITIDTSALSGSSVAWAFDLTQGDGVSSSLTLSNFATDGLLGQASSVGGPLVGALPGPVTLGDSDFFNEFLQEMTLGSMVSFRLSLTENFAGPTPAAFSLFLLDTTTGIPLFETADPTGANALFAVDIDGTAFGRHQVFTPMAAGGTLLTASPFTPDSGPDTGPISVPEPASGLLFLFGAIGALLMLRRESGRRPGLGAS